jgi:hypothetical protein
VGIDIGAGATGGGISGEVSTAEKGRLHDKVRITRADKTSKIFVRFIFFFSFGLECASIMRVLSKKFNSVFGGVGF